jgi:hypothetical protein
MSSAYIRAMPTIDLPSDELAAVTAVIRRVIAGDRYPHAPRLDPLRAALARLDAASTPAPHPKAPPAAKGGKPRHICAARREKRQAKQWRQNRYRHKRSTRAWILCERPRRNEGHCIFRSGKKQAPPPAKADQRARR